MTWSSLYKLQWPLESKPLLLLMKPHLNSPEPDFYVDLHQIVNIDIGPLNMSDLFSIKTHIWQINTSFENVRISQCERKLKTKPGLCCWLTQHPSTKFWGCLFHKVCVNLPTNSRTNNTDEDITSSAKETSEGFSVKEKIANSSCIWRCVRNFHPSRWLLVQVVKISSLVHTQ